MLTFSQVLEGIDISPRNDSRRDAKACQAKRLRINKEMQTFMKDSKSSRKAAGIPREKQQEMCAFQICFIARTDSLRIPCQGNGKFYFLLKSYTFCFSKFQSCLCIPSEAVCENKLIPNFSKSLGSKVHSTNDAKFYGPNFPQILP